MTCPDLRIDTLSAQREISVGVAPATVLERVNAGELVFVRKYLQHVRLYDACHALLLEAVNDVCGERAQAAVSADGLSRLHWHVDKHQLQEVYAQLRKVLADKMPYVTANMFRLLGAQDPFFVHTASLIRMQYPHEATRGLQQTFKRSALGKLHPHGPHHDHFQNVPFNAINTWVALTDIDASNGMLVYPDVWGCNLEQGDEIVADNYALGQPHWVEMAAGDALIFHSNHLHSSQLNYSDTTRVVLTNRICLEQPSYPDAERPQQYFDSTTFVRADDFSDVFLEPGFCGDRTAIVPPEPPDAATQARVQREHRARLEAGRQRRTTPREVGATDANPQVAEGQIVALDARTCLTRIDGQDYTFARRCPHEAADLARGFVENGKIVCPFHGARLCPASGQCEGIQSMKFRARKVARAEEPVCP